MAWNDSTHQPAARGHETFRRSLAWAALACAAVLAGCSVSGPRESPLNAVTRDSPTVLEVYKGEFRAGKREVPPQTRLRTESVARGIQQGDGDTQRYWSAIEPLKQRFARVPNPDIVMVVYPHLAKGQYPVQGYVTVFPMYEQTQYALPGEVEEDLLDGRALYGKGTAR